MDIELYDDCTITEQYIDKNGRTVLWRRFNRDSMKLEQFGSKWSERFPHNEKIYVNGEICVHWHDIITDYILYTPVYKKESKKNEERGQKDQCREDCRKKYGEFG